MHYWSRLCGAWSRLVFRDKIAGLTPKVRTVRLLEEALELAQSEGVTLAEVQTVAEQVFKKPVGVPRMELGGVLITTAAYAATRGLDLDDVFMDEFTRIMDPAIMERVRTRNLSGDKIGFDHAAAVEGRPQRPANEATYGGPGPEPGRG